MFGHQDDKSSDDQSAASDQTAATDNSNPLNISTPATTASGFMPSNPSDFTTGGDEAEDSSDSSDTMLGPPADDQEAPSSMFNSSVSTPAAEPQPTDNPPAQSSDNDDLPMTTPASTVVDNNLASIKQSALQQLQPLVGHLDQTPEEKFRTTMMMIQGSDDQSLIPSAYEAAQAITDEKERAQALLDVVNEINYFSQPTTASKD